MKLIPNFILNMLFVAATVWLYRYIAPMLGFTWQELLLITAVVMLMSIIDRLIWVKVVLTAIGDRVAEYEKLRNTVIRLSSPPPDMPPSTHIRKGLL